MTELSLEQPGNHYFVRSISGSDIRVGEESYGNSLIIGAEQMLTDWQPQSVEEITTENLREVLSLKPEVVLLGTGKKQVFLHPQVLSEFYQQGVGVEVMTTEAACRTFNVLVTEGRKVVAALLPLTA